MLLLNGRSGSEAVACSRYAREICSNQCPDSSARARQLFKINDLGVNSSFAAVLPHHFQFRYIIIKQQVIFSFDHLARNLVVRQAYLTDQNIIKALE